MTIAPSFEIQELDLDAEILCQATNDPCSNPGEWVLQFSCGAQSLPMCTPHKIGFDKIVESPHFVVAQCPQKHVHSYEEMSWRRI